MALQKITLITAWDMDDPYSWSGVCYHAVRALERNADVHRIQLKTNKPHVIDRALTFLMGRFGKAYLPSHGLATSIRDSIRTRHTLKSIGEADAYVFLAASTSSIALTSYITKVQVTDSSFSAMELSYYPNHQLSRISSVQGKIVDWLGARGTDLYSVASEWSQEVLFRDLHIPAEKNILNPFGPGTVPVQYRVPFQKTEAEPLKLLFISSHWVRKGGDHVLSIAEKVRKTRPVELTIVGKVPQELPEWVEHLPYMSREELSVVYSEHDILLEITSGSAGGVVVTDALCHGLPVLATRVGGMLTLVQHEKTGWLIPAENSVEQGTQILSHLPRSDVENASAQSLKLSEEYTWDRWAQRLLSSIQQVHDLS